MKAHGSIQGQYLIVVACYATIFEFSNNGDQEDWQDLINRVEGNFLMEDDDGMDGATDVPRQRNYRTAGGCVEDYKSNCEPMWQKVDANFEKKAQAASELDPAIQLNECQQLAREMIVDLVKREP